MRQSDFVAVALRGVKKIALPGALFLTVAVWLLGTAAAKAFWLYREKQAPCLLEASGENISEGDVQSLMQRENTEQTGDGESRLHSSEGQKGGDILEYTLIYTLDAGISAGGYHTEVTLTGVDGDFLSPELKEGTMFPADTGMPWLIVNEVALKTFRDNNEEDIENIEAVDWQNTSVSLAVGEKIIVGKICGILETKEETEAPVVYLSQESAKALLQQNAQTVSAAALWLRLKNSGVSENVTENLNAMGYTVANSDAGLWQEWELTRQTILGESMTGLLALLAGIFLLKIKIQYDALACREEYARLQELFLSPKNVRKRMNTVRVVAVFAASLVLGIVLLLAMPTLLKVTTG